MAGAHGVKFAALIVASVLFSGCDLGNNSSAPSASTGSTDTSTSSSGDSSSATNSAATSNIASPSAQGTSVGSATLVWSPPTENTNGSMLTNLAGYKIYFGRSTSALTEVIDVKSASISSYVVDKLVSGTYYFALSAYNAAGVESAMQLVGSKTIP
jgi:hypothetical protein